MAVEYHSPTVTADRRLSGLIKTQWLYEKQKAIGDSKTTEEHKNDENIRKEMKIQKSSLKHAAEQLKGCNNVGIKIDTFGVFPKEDSYAETEEVKEANPKIKNYKDPAYF